MLNIINHEYLLLYFTITCKSGEKLGENKICIIKLQIAYQELALVFGSRQRSDTISSREKLY